MIFMKTDDAAARLEALGNPTRLQIYRALVRAGDAGMPVGKLQAKLDLAASTLSHHLKSLLVVDLITQERQATTLICRANYDVMRGLVDFLAAECCVEIHLRSHASQGQSRLIFLPHYSIVLEQQEYVMNAEQKTVASRRRQTNKRERVRT